MSDRNLCPVKDCTNLRDDDNGVLCWRHRQFVLRRLIAKIKAAQRELRSCADQSRLPYYRGELTKAINEAAAAAKRAQEQLQATRQREADDAV